LEDFESIAVSSDIDVVSVIQVSDSLVSMPGDDTEAFAPFCGRMQGAYSAYDRLGYFVSLMDLAVERDVDLIALTGDQVNYPGSCAIE
jgi:hypothetical protein